MVLQSLWFSCLFFVVVVGGLVSTVFSVFMKKCHKILYLSFPIIDFGLYSYHFFLSLHVHNLGYYPNTLFYLLQTYLSLYSFCINLQDLGNGKYFHVFSTDSVFALWLGFIKLSKFVYQVRAWCLSSYNQQFSFCFRFPPVNHKHFSLFPAFSVYCMN